MSVAFRRDGDDEHKEPKFELPLPPGPNIVTPKGLALIQDRVRTLEAEIERDGDEEESAREDRRRQLRYWRTRQATAQIAPPPPGDEIAFGSRVRFLLNGKERRIDIVGDDEADPASDRIAFSAPLARAMIGAGAGDMLDFGGRPEAIEILSAAPIDD